ncbi:MAG: RecX family [Planctomycetota bacterium]|jgi:SOS response regulatory protein OraA/RecX
MSVRVTLTAIRADPRDPAMVRLELQGTPIGSIRRDDARRLGLTEGMAWTATRARAVQALLDEAACRHDALRRLGRHDLSRAMLTARLAARWGADLAARTADALAQGGWLDDDAYARRRAERLAARSPLSSEALQARLESEGVLPRVAARAVSAHQDPDALHAHVRTWKRAGRDGTWIARKLARGGFDADSIAAALHRARIPWPHLD